MVWWREFADRTEYDAPLAPLTWFRLGGPARYLVTPRDADDLASLRRRALNEGLPFHILGQGANVLVCDEGVPGIVARLTAGVFGRWRFDGAAVVAGAGVDLMRLIPICCRRGLAGLEGLAGIPSSIGGAVKMNAGGRFGEFGTVVRRITVLNVQGAVKVRDRDEIGFAYRRSNLAGAIVLSAELELRRDDPAVLHDRYHEVWAHKQASQPMSGRSAGCIFKNPPGHSAGALIDQAGLKGFSHGGARVSHRHANFIVTDDGARAADVLRLVDGIRNKVRDSFGIELELEVDVW